MRIFQRWVGQVERAHGPQLLAAGRPSVVRLAVGRMQVPAFVLASRGELLASALALVRRQQQRVLPARKCAMLCSMAPSLTRRASRYDVALHLEARRVREEIKL
jgi:hypothetical protein